MASKTILMFNFLLDTIFSNNYDIIFQNIQRCYR